MRAPPIAKFRCLLAVIGALAFAGAAWAGAVQRYLPLRLQTDSGPVRTSACAEVTERLYEDPAWWKLESKAVDEQQRAFKAVLDAVHRKDVRALESLSSSTGASEDGHRQQLQLMVGQSAYLGGINAVRLYELGSVLVAFARSEVEGKSGLLTLVFSKQGEQYLLLTAKPRTPAFVLLRDWANSPWGVLDPAAMSYCANEEMARTNVRVTISSANVPEESGDLNIDLNLMAMGDSSVAANGAVSSVLDAYAQMKQTAEKDQLTGLLPFLEREDSESVRRLMADAQGADQLRLIKRTLLGDAVAAVDAGPLIVLYTRSKDSAAVQAFYFLVEPGKNPRWVSFSRLSQLDPVFKSGLLLEAARSETALAKLRKRP